MKQCFDCKQVLSLDNFNKAPKNKDGLRNDCRTCTKAKDAAKYANEPARRVAIRSSNAARQDAARRWVWDYLSDHPCVDCQESDPVVLEFDHVTGVKISEVGKMVASGNLTAIKVEVEKCEVRCANCHRRVTYRRAGSYRSLFSDNGSTLLS